MNNGTFSDVMDKVNVTAKSMNFTNGIAWARNAFENKKLSLLEYSDYERCHDLRNLMAHGCARDIQISNETLQLAHAFYAAIIGTSAPAKAPAPSSKPQRRFTKTPIRVGDYVIMMRPQKRYWSNFSVTPDEADLDQRQFTPGFVYRVEDKYLNLYALTAPKGEYGERRWLMHHSDCAYIFRTKQELDIPGKTLYIIENPQPTKIDGKLFLTFQYVQYDPQEQEQQVLTMTCEGYLADPYTFTTPYVKVSERDDASASLKVEDEITVSPQYNVELEGHVRMNDFAILMLKEDHYWGTFTKRPDPNATEQRTFKMGLVGQITDPKLNSLHMLTWNRDVECTFGLNIECESAYVFRTDMIMDYGLTPYVVEKPVEFEKNGKSYLTIRYIQYDEGNSRSEEIIEHTCEGYRVGVKTFQWLNKVYDVEGKRSLN